MHTKHKAALGALILGSLVCTGCDGVTASGVAEAVVEEVLPGGDEGEDPESQAIAGDFCTAAMTRIQLRGEMGECDLALVQDCANVVGLLSADYLRALRDCMSDDRLPGECMFEVTMDLAPTEAHRSLAKDYCDDCLFGVDGCEDIFYFGDRDQIGLGSILLPFNDAVVQQVNDECTEDLTCSVDLPSCAQEVLVDHLVPEKTIACLIDPFRF